MRKLRRYAMISLLSIFGLGACLLIEPSEGSVSFGYVILTQNPDDPTFQENGQDAKDPATFLARDCSLVGASFIEVKLLRQDGEFFASQKPCNSSNVGDSVLTPDEFGTFSGTFPAGEYRGLSIKLLGENGEPVSIRPIEEDANRLNDASLEGDLIFFDASVSISSNVITDLNFDGEGQFGVDVDGDGLADVNELQIFVSFTP